MKPPPFAYEAPRSLDAALGLMGDGVMPLAGGQSLVPMLNFRQIRPRKLVDLNGVGELAFVERVGDALRLGAMTRLATLERSPQVARDWPLLRQAISHAGHPATRSRGTVGGSVAHGDPRAELPAALLALDAGLRLRSPRGERTVGIDQFLLGAGRTALAADELLTEIVVPLPAAGARAAFVEHAPTHGDFAIAAVAALVAPREHAAIVLLGAGPSAIRCGQAEEALITGAAVDGVAALAARDVQDPHRRALLGELVRRALAE